MFKDLLTIRRHNSLLLKKISTCFEKQTTYILLLSCVICFSYSTSFGSLITINAHSDTLPNGLRYIIVPDTTVAVVSCRLYYFVGSINEGPGTTGLSHMYEHMMFKGTQRLGTKDHKREIPIMKSLDKLEAQFVQKKQAGLDDTDTSIIRLRQQIAEELDFQRQFIAKDEIWQLYQNNGATNLNAWTGDELTAYIVTLPQNKIELFFWIEADRMANPVLREFFSERDVVLEERRMRYDNQPSNRYSERLQSLFFVAHPFRNPTIGWSSDIESYTRITLMNHVKRFYTPDNAVIILVGNVQPKHAIALLKKYFKPIRRASTPKPEVVTREPEPIGETRFVVKEDAQPRIDILFHTPGYPNNDLYSLDIVEGVLSGRSGRLYKRLVTDEKLCVDVGASNNYQLHNSIFHIFAQLKVDANPKKVEEIILEELEKLMKKEPSHEEIERIKNTIAMQFTSQLQGLEGLSDQLAWFQRLGDYRDLLKYPEKIQRVALDSVPIIARRYFQSDLKTIGFLLPKNKWNVKE